MADLREHALSTAKIGALARSPAAHILRAGKIFACANLSLWLAGKSQAKNARVVLKIPIK
jgi:hypothetical protein